MEKTLEKRIENTTKEKNKKDFEEIRKEEVKQRDEIDERLKKKDYVLTVYQTGHKGISLGDYEREVDTRRFYAVCSLEEIPEYIEYMKKPFWEVPDGLSEKEIKNYPYEKKKWGRYWNVVIEPLSEEMEKSYLSGSKEGFFKSWRTIRDGDDLDEIDYSTTVHEN